jgi:hypothetical protein
MIDNIAEVETFRELTGAELDLVGGGAGFDPFGAVGGAILGGLLGATYGPIVGGNAAGSGGGLFGGLASLVGAAGGLVVGAPAGAVGGFWYGSQTGQGNILNLGSAWAQNIVNTPLR